MIEATAIRAATVLLRLGSRSLLTDPWFGERMWWILPTRQKPGIRLAALPHVDLVLATHLHPDHYDRRSARALFDRAEPPSRFIGPKGAGPFLPAAVRGRLREMVPWQQIEEKDLRITATPCLHTGPPPAEVNYVVESNDAAIFFGGDCRYSETFMEVRRRFARIDVAFLPVSGTLIFGRRTTMDEEDALRAAADLGAKVVVPIHEGGVWMSVPPASRHPGRAHRLAQLARERSAPFEVVCLDPGESARLDRH
jgi:N-acyl-phosphatidylethanolamine-hydrolysing phospholipase D